MLLWYCCSSWLERYNRRHASSHLPVNPSPRSRSRSLSRSIIISTDKSFQAGLHDCMPNSICCARRRHCMTSSMGTRFTGFRKFRLSLRRMISQSTSEPLMIRAPYAPSFENTRSVHRVGFLLGEYWFPTSCLGSRSRLVYLAYRSIHSILWLKALVLRAMRGNTNPGKLLRLEVFGASYDSCPTENSRSVWTLENIVIEKGTIDTV